MREILRQSNLDLLREINRLESALASVSPLPELVGYYEWGSQACEDLHTHVRSNVHDLNLGKGEILPDILSQTQGLTQVYRLYNERLAGPILRSLPSDQLSLRVIAWLHATHPDTQAVPAGLSDGAFSIWPEPRFPILYFMPASRQRGLLYLPLFFHEFGHLLYACHKPEMDDLVGEFQEEVSELLEPASQRDDPYAREAARTRSAIVDTWYAWTQEVFCDVVGLTIGGPCFAYAFSTYLRMGGRGEFSLPREKLEYRNHPLTWLRIRLLAVQMHEMDLSSEANRIEAEWDGIAEMTGVVEDYYGFYEPAFLPALRRTIDDMLIETSPRRYTDSDISSAEWTPGSSSPVHLLNRAWSMFLNDSDNYGEWEEGAISAYLAEKTDGERAQ